MTGNTVDKPAEPQDGEPSLPTPRSLLREYDQIKLELAGLVREVLGQTKGDDPAWQEGRELLARLAEDRFNVAVVGRFSRGKSTLMNAVLGTDRLPTGILPLTSVITMVRYGSSERALVYYEQSMLTSEISLDNLPDYVTQEGNPGNCKGVAYVEVQIPSETLRRGFSFVDTPGLGSPIIASDAITTGYFPEMDAVILVTSFEAALSPEEIDFLRQAVQGGRKTFLVINKLDLVTGDERGKVARYVEDMLSDIAGVSTVKVYAVSARDGLVAKQNNDAEKLLESGLPEFEHELVRFLTTEKAEQILLLTCRRLLHVATMAGTAPNAAVAMRVREIQEKFPHVEAKGLTGVVPDVTAAFLRSEQLGLEKSCPICGETVSRVFDFFAKYQYQLSTSRAVQSAHAAAGGFCPMHTWQYEKIASPRGICAAYEVALNAVAQQLRGIASNAVSVEDLSLGLDGLAETHPACKACEVQASAVEAALARLVSTVSESGKAGLPELPFLCFQHLPPFLTRIDDVELARKLMEQHAEMCERVSENMQRYILKYDSIRRALLSEEERRAPLQGLRILAGHSKIAAAGIETED